MNMAVFVCLRWYHGHLSGPNAEKLLVARDEVFTFLVRESLSAPGDFVLSVLTNTIGKTGTKRVSHIKIMCRVCACVCLWLCVQCVIEGFKIETRFFGFHRCTNVSSCSRWTFVRNIQGIPNIATYR